MKTTLIAIGIVAGIVIAIQLIPFFIASIGVAEYQAHNWYCNSTGGRMSHMQREDYVKGITSEICQYN